MLVWTTYEHVCVRARVLATTTHLNVFTVHWGANGVAKDKDVLIRVLSLHEGYLVLHAYGEGYSDKVMNQGANVFFGEIKSGNIQCRTSI
eukprot:1158916-Pelagomonas_calceolata.AAC.14